MNDSPILFFPINGKLKTKMGACNQMIHELVHTLLSFYPEFNLKNYQIQQNEYDENDFEVFDGDEAFFFITLTDKGLLEDFSIDEDYFPGNQTFEKEEILQKAELFMDTLMKDTRASLHTTSIINFDHFWYIEFARKDPYLQLELPNSGASVSINPNGVITNVTIETEEIGIEQPNPKISPEEAKALYLQHLMLVPIIMKIDSDYIGGDEAYHFVYYAADHIMTIHMDGTLDTIETYGGTYPEYEKLAPTTQTFTHLYEAIGMPDYFTKVHVAGNLEQWSPNGLTGDDEDYLDIEYNQSRNVSAIHFMPDIENLTSAFDQAAALEKAISFLTFQFKDAATAFRLVVEEYALSYYDDDEILQTYAYRFNFQRFERDVLVAIEPISITVDASNLMITNYSTDEAYEYDFSAMDLGITYSKELAKAAYAEKLAVEKTWSKEVDEDPVIYKLVYSTAFPETIGAMRAIDAKTGKTWFIDASYMDEL